MGRESEPRERASVFRLPLAGNVVCTQGGGDGHSKNSGGAKRMGTEGGKNTYCLGDKEANNWKDA